MCECVNVCVSVSVFVCLVRYRPHCCVCIFKKLKYVIYTASLLERKILHMEFFFLALSLKLLESQIFLANFFRIQRRHGLFI